MDFQLIHSFKKNDHEEIRIALREYKERWYIDVRLYFQPDGAAEMVPSKKGLTIGVEHISELAQGMEKIANVVNTMSLDVKK